MSQAHDWFEICKAGNFELVKTLTLSSDQLQNGFSGACRGGHMKLVEFFISNFEINHLTTGLCHACQGCHIHVVKYIISKLEQQYPDWASIFESACKGGNMDIVKFIFSISDGKYYIDAGLMGAAAGGHIDVAEYISSKGANNYGVPLEKFVQVDGYKNLQTSMINVKQSILGSNMMLSDLLMIVSKCIII